MKITAIMGQEILAQWIDVLNDALQCIPMFDFSKYRLPDALDEVKYADIETKTQDSPESSDRC